MGGPGGCRLACPHCPAAPLSWFYLRLLKPLKTCWLGGSPCSDSCLLSVPSFMVKPTFLHIYVPLLMGDAAVVVFGVLGVDVETSLSQLFLSSPMVLNPVVFWLPSPCFVPSHLNTIIKGQSTNEKKIMANLYIPELDAHKTPPISAFIVRHF